MCSLQWWDKLSAPSFRPCLSHTRRRRLGIVASSQMECDSSACRRDHTPAPCPWPCFVQHLSDRNAKNSRRGGHWQPSMHRNPAALCPGIRTAALHVRKFLASNHVLTSDLLRRVKGICHLAIDGLAGVVSVPWIVQLDLAAFQAHVRVCHTRISRQFIRRWKWQCGKTRTECFPELVRAEKYLLYARRRDN